MGEPPAIAAVVSQMTQMTTLNACRKRELATRCCLNTNHFLLYYVPSTVVTSLVTYLQTNTVVLTIDSFGHLNSPVFFFFLPSYDLLHHGLPIVYQYWLIILVLEVIFKTVLIQASGPSIILLVFELDLPPNLPNA